MPKDDFASLMEASLKSDASRARKRLSAGDVVEGSVIQIGPDSVFVDIGTPADARMDRNGFEDREGNLRLAVGDRVRATVVDPSPDAPVLATSMGHGGALAGAELAMALESGTPVEGRVSKAVKAGLEIELGSLRAFCPASQVELGYVADLTSYEGQTLEFKVLEVRDGGRSIVLSRRALLEDERRQKLEEMSGVLTPGSDLEGVVHSTQKHGAVIDLGGVEGFVHISELSPHRVERVEDIVREGETVRVRVLAVEENHKGGTRVRLSMKALAQPAEHELPAKDEVLEATVTRLANFGVFVDTKIGEGLVPTRELGLPHGSDHRKALPVGTQVQVVLLSRDPDNGKLRFSARGVASVEERRNFRDFSSGGSGSLGSLGDVLRRKLGLPEPPPEPPKRANPPAPPPAPARATVPEAAAPQNPAPEPRLAPEDAPKPAAPKPAEKERRPDPPGVIRRKPR